MIKPLIYRCVKKGLLALLYCAFLITVFKAPLGAAQSGPIQIIIEWPNEGEIIYAGPSSLLFSVPIKGWVESDSYTLDEVLVTLRVYQEGVLVEEQNEELYGDNSFVFYATINPHGSDGQFPAGLATCGDYCHLPGSFTLPQGHIRLQITAGDPDSGEKATVNRNIVVDVSQYASIPVEVYFSDAPEQKISGITIIGSTWLHLWRTRNFRASTGEDGNADLQVEALTAASTTYEFRVEPTYIDGVLYEGVNTVTQTLPPGASIGEPIKLMITSHRGDISGKLVNVDNLEKQGLHVWAIKLPEGSNLKMAINEDGSFYFQDVPIYNYVLALDESMLIDRGFYGSPKKAYLEMDHQVALQLPLTQIESLPIRGVLMDIGGNTVPFGWGQFEGRGEMVGVFPDVGEFTLYNLPHEPNSVTFGAPGYYAQVIRLGASRDDTDPIELTLVPQPGTIHLSWGQGEIVVPSDSRGEVNDDRITLERGWVWGEGDQVPPIWINTKHGEIEISGGRFALEYIPGYTGWFYLFDGEARIHRAGMPTALVVHSGEMVNLLKPNDLQAVPYDAVVYTALKPGNMPLAELVIEPTSLEVLGNRVEGIIVGAAQTLTLVTYFLAVLALIIVPVYALYSRRKSK